VRPAAVLLALAITGAAAGCGGASRPFVEDDHLAITSPAPLEVVETPFDVSWSSSEQGDRSFAVFVDVTPVAPGHQLRDMADDQCRRVAGCPDERYLAGLGVYVTTADHVTVTRLPAIGGTAGQADHPVHTITLIGLDDSGRRRGDAARTIEIRA
jgi:hypothetical protein